jgi:hypothetical protein
MKLSTKIGNYSVEVEGATTEELFDKMAEMSDLLSSGDVCGVSDSTNIIMRKRVSGEYTFYEWFCKESGCSLALGRTKAGGFYPRRKDKEGNWLPNRGWTKWEGSHNKVETEEAVPF